MIGDIRKILEADKFVPFIIHMADGRHIRVPSQDHIAISPNRAIVTHDEDDYDILPGLLMTGLTVDPSAVGSEFV